MYNLPDLPRGRLELDIVAYEAHATGKHDKKGGREVSVGLSSLVKGTNGLNMIFLDYDDAGRGTVVDDLRALQERYKLGDAHIYASVENSNHAIFFYDLVPINKLIEIMNSSPYTCKGHVLRTGQEGRAVLRLTRKPERPRPSFISCIHSQYQKHKSQKEIDWGEYLRATNDALLESRVVKEEDLDKILSKPLLIG